jgi:hypothetical protein
MFPGEARPPEGLFVGWVPNATPFSGSDGLAFRVEPRTEIVVQMHLRPSGKLETIQSSIGLYFSKMPPARTAAILSIGSQTIDIPAGARNYTIEDSYVLPVDVEVLSVLPHAHYLGKEIDGYAVLPDGTKRWLIRIGDWDLTARRLMLREPSSSPGTTTPCA